MDSGIGRLVSSPNTNGSRCNGLSRRSWVCSQVVPGTRSSRVRKLNCGGKNLWKLSDGVSTTRPIRSGCRVIRSWVSAPPVSLATTVTSFRSSASRNSAISRAMPGGVRSASGFIGSVCAPSGQSGARHRCSRLTAGTTLRHRSALTSRPCTNTTGGPAPRSR